MSNRNKNILLGILIVGVLAMTVAFAALTTRLNLSGTANVAALKWNIHFDGWDNVTQDIVDGHSNTSEIDDTQISQTLSPNITKIDNVNVTLKQPGDYIKYNFIIKNDGTIAGKLSNFTKTLTPTNEVVGFTVNCYESNTREGTPITTNYVLPADKTVYCYLEVQYKDQTNTNTSGSNQVYEQSAINASISADWTWIQDDSNSSQSGSQESGNEQGNSGQTTESWNKYSSKQVIPDGNFYAKGDLQVLDSVNDMWKEYIREDTVNNKKEVCGVFSNATVCVKETKLSDNTWDCGDLVNGECSNSTGYIASKKHEYEAAGATCSFNAATNLMCDDEDADVHCQLNSDGNNYCYSYSPYEYCYLNSGGSTYCD